MAGGRCWLLLFGECEISFLSDGLLIPVLIGNDQCLVGILAVEKSKWTLGPGRKLGNMGCALTCGDDGVNWPWLVSGLHKRVLGS